MKTVERKKWQCLSGSALKLIALVTMLIDHITYFLLYDESFFITPMFTVGKTAVTWYYVMRTIGRMAFPIYCFLITEGFLYTRDRKKYGIRLLCFALISEIPWNYVHTGTWLYQGQNVFFTLFFGYLCLYVLEESNLRPYFKAGIVIAVFGLAFVFQADYGYAGIAVILAMHYLKKFVLARALVCTCLCSASWRAGLAFIPITLYNGERGFIRGRFAQYFFYAFYPIHMLIIGLLKYNLGL